MPTRLPLVLVPQYFGCLVFERRTSRYLPFDREATELLLALHRRPIDALLRKDLFDILDAATGRGLHPCLTTNALLLTEDTAREFGKRELVWLNVSLEGPSAETNDPVRGAGTFDAVLEKLKLLGRHARFT